MPRPERAACYRRHMTADAPTILATSGGLRPGPAEPLRVRPAAHVRDRPGRRRPAARRASAWSAPPAGTRPGSRRLFTEAGRIAGATVSALRALHHAERGRHGGVRPGAGRDLGQRRQRGQPARAVAAARAGRDLPRRPGRPGSCWPACRRARSAGTSAAPRTRSARTCGRSPTVWPSCRTRTACTTTTRSSDGRSSTTLIARRDAARRLRDRRRGRAAVPRHRTGRGRHRGPRQGRLPGHVAATARSARSAWSRGCCPAAL